ncbi:hypothetical protein pb186bvf_016589 [Paramecium bursaria]
MNPNYKLILNQITSYKIQGARVFAAGLLIELMIGIFYAWPIIFSYYNILEHGQASIILTALMTSIMNLALPYSDTFLNYFGAKQSVFILTGVIQISLIVIAIFSQYIYLHYVVLLFFFSPAIGILHSIPFLSSSKYFIKQKMHLNSVFQIFLGIGAILALYIFESRLEDQQSIYYDDQQNYCGECYNFRVRQQFKSLAIWALFLGISASLLVRKPDDETAEAMVDYDLLAFSHWDIPVVSVNTDNFDKDQMTVTQAIKTEQFYIVCVFAISCSFLSYVFMTQYQSILSSFGISYRLSNNLFKFTILGYGMFRLVIQQFLKNMNQSQAFTFLIIFQVSLFAILLIGLILNVQQLIYTAGSFLVISLSGLMSILTTFIPRIFGYLSTSRIFQIILLVMAITCLSQSLITYGIRMAIDFDSNLKVKYALIAYSIKLAITQIILSRKLNAL